ncbi:MAG: ABC transporter substrate-binding protein [Alphaproteobacteria bacterium]|nr:ABC transporter substrate-binding protein [Alphaproteobacteria bacterium]
MKKILAFIFSAFLLMTSEAKADIDAVKAENFIKNVTKQGIEELINSDVSEVEKKARFTKLFNEDLDLDFIGKFVLGRYWRTANEKQRKEFIDVYRKLNIQTWSERFNEFKGKHFEFLGTEKANSKANDQVYVNTQVPMQEGEPASVKWRVKDVGSKMQIVDIIIENVSLAITAQKEYTSYIQKSPDGIDGLIKDLKAKLK